MAARLAGLFSARPQGCTAPTAGAGWVLLSSGGGGGRGGGRQAGKKPLTWGLKNKGQGFLYLGQSPLPGSSLMDTEMLGPGRPGNSFAVEPYWVGQRASAGWQPEKLLPHFLCPDFHPHLEVRHQG